MLVTPFLFLLLLFAVAAGRLVQGKLDVDSAIKEKAQDIQGSYYVSNGT